MSLNQTTLISEVASQMVRDDLDARIAIWLTWGLNRIDRYADLKGLGKRVKCACVVGQTEYAFPTDLKYVRTFRLLDHKLDTFATTDVDTTANTMEVGRAITTNTRIIFLNADPPAPLVTGTVYYAINVDATTIQVSATEGGDAIALVDEGTGTHAIQIYGSGRSIKLEYVPEVTFDANTPDITTLTSNKAEGYIDRGDIYELTTPPDDTWLLDMRYIKWQDALSAGETPEISYADDLIVAATIVEGWVALGEDDKAKNAQARFIGLLSGHRAVERLRPDYAPKGTGFQGDSMRWSKVAEAYKYPFEGLRQ